VSLAQGLLSVWGGVGGVAPQMSLEGLVAVRIKGFAGAEDLEQAGVEGDVGG